MRCEDTRGLGMRYFFRWELTDLLARSLPGLQFWNPPARLCPVSNALQTSIGKRHSHPELLSTLAWPRRAFLVFFCAFFRGNLSMSLPRGFHHLTTWVAVNPPPDIALNTLRGPLVHSDWLQWMRCRRYEYTPSSFFIAVIHREAAEAAEADQEGLRQVLQNVKWPQSYS